MHQESRLHADILLCVVQPYEKYVLGNEMYLLNYYKTARFCVVSYTAGSLLLFGVTQRQERCVASLECGIFTGCPRGPEPPGHKGYNVLDVVVCLFLCFSVDDFASGKIETLGETTSFLGTKHY